MSTYTRGPWSVHNDEGISIIGDDGARLANVTFLHLRGRRDTPEVEANARLIAAAPDMLEALKGIDHFSDALAHRSDPLSVALREWINAGRAAIAKATGGAS